MTPTLSRRNLLHGALLAGMGAVAEGPQNLWAAAPAVTETPPRPFHIKTLGTGAADHDWSRLGQPGVRGSASTLIDAHILIDCGSTGSANLTRAGILPNAVTDLIITHSHSDHFNVVEIRKVIESRSPEQPPLTIWAVQQALAKLYQQIPGRFRGKALEPGTLFDIGRCHLTALPANHQLPDLSEHALHFLIETPCGNLLYALDGAWMLKQTRQLIGKKRLNMVIWDATMSKTGDTRIFEHNDLSMIGLMMQSLATTGGVDAKTVCVLDHVARTLWPSDIVQAEKLATERGWILAADRMDLELR